MSAVKTLLDIGPTPIEASTTFEQPAPRISLVSAVSSPPSLAPTSVPRARELAWTVLEVAFGSTVSESSVSFGPDGLQWKTWPAVRVGGCHTSGKGWNDSTTKRYRSQLRRAIAERFTDEPASSLLPTLTETANLLAPSMQKWPGHRRLIPTLMASRDGRFFEGKKERLRIGGALLPTLTMNRYGSTNNGSPHDGRTEYATKGTLSLDSQAGQAGGSLNPSWCEWFMGYPEGWTASDGRPWGIP
jgi:hypothetical protein